MVKDAVSQVDNEHMNKKKSKKCLSAASVYVEMREVASSASPALSARALPKAKAQMWASGALFCPRFRMMAARDQANRRVGASGVPQKWFL